MFGSKESSLLGVCYAFFRHWYPGIKTTRLTETERRRDYEKSYWEMDDE